MKRSRFTEEQIIAILREQEAGSKTADVNARSELIERDIERLEKATSVPARAITLEIIHKFAAVLKQQLRGDDPTVRRGYMRMFVDEVIVDRNEVTIRGSKRALEHALVARSAPKDGVPAFVREWRATQSAANRSLPDLIGRVTGDRVSIETRPPSRRSKNRGNVPLASDLG